MGFWLEFYHPVMLAMAIAVVSFMLLYLIWKSVIIVGGTELAVLERKYFGKKMPQGRVIALSGEIGIHAKPLGPGLHFLVPFLFAPTKFPFTNILESEIGLIESIDGDVIPPGKIFAQVVEGHNSFQDGENFLINLGEKGPQIQLLSPGTYRINPNSFQSA